MSGVSDRPLKFGLGRDLQHYQNFTRKSSQEIAENDGGRGRRIRFPGNAEGASRRRLTIVWPRFSKIYNIIRILLPRPRIDEFRQRSIFVRLQARRNDIVQSSLVGISTWK